MRRGMFYFSVIVFSAILLIPIPILPAMSTNGIGWLDGWSHRKSHVINPAPGAGANYQVKIVVHYGYGTDRGADVYCGNQCRTDFGDIRFTDDDGVTLLDYWIEKKTDSHNATFWIEIADDLSSSDVTIYAYYGNPGASTTSNGDATFILFDSYDDNSLDVNKWNWQLDNNNASSVHLAEQNQRMESWKDEGSGVSGANYRESDDSWPLERIVEFELYVDYDRTEIGGYAHQWHVWHQDDNNHMSCTYGSYNSTHFRIILDKVEGGSHTRGVWAHFSWDTWYYVRTRVNSTSIVLEVFSDGFDETLEHVQYLSHTRTGNGRFYHRIASTSSGTFGFRYFDDDFRVRKYTYPEPTHGSWEGGWLNGWGYRKSHIIQNSSDADTNYQVKIVVHYGYGMDNLTSVYCNNNCRPDFGDIRFTDDDGVTLLDYWIEEKTDYDKSIFWVKITDNLSDNDALIYVYYGNIQSISTSSGENTFIFFDDFEGGTVNSSRWDINGTGANDTVSVVNDPAGVSNKVLKVHESGDDIVTTVNTKEWPDSGGVAIALEWRRSADYYYWAEYMQYCHIWKANYVVIFTEAIYFSGNRHRWWDGSDYVDYSPTLSTSANTWYKLEYKASAGSMKVEAHSTEHTGGYRKPYGNPRRFSPLQFGKVEANRDAFIDNVRVRKYVDPEPEHGIWGNEEFNWLAGWNYRKGHIINPAAGAGTNYQVKIAVCYDFGVDNGAEVYCGNRCRADFGDIRFTDDDGITLLDYWMEEESDYDKAIFWVEVADNLSSDSALIYVYYGNGNVTTTSNGTNTFLFFDDFEDGTVSGWNTVSETGSPNITASTNYAYDGSYSMELSGTDDSRHFAYQNLGVEDYAIAAWVYNPAKGPDIYDSMGLAVRFLNVDNYYWFGQRRPDPIPDLSIRRLADGSETVLGSYTWSQSNMYGVWEKMEFRIDGSQLKGCINDSEYLSATDSDLLSGEIALWSYRNQDDDIAYFDNVFVRKYVYPEPTHGAWKGSPTDDEAPLIDYVSYYPTQPTYLEDVTVVAEVLDQSSLSSVLLYVNNGSIWVPISMIHVGGTVFNVTIPAQPAYTQVSFLIEAKDTVGNTANSSTYTYYVSDIPIDWTNYTVDVRSTLNVMLDVRSNQSIQVNIVGTNLPGPPSLQFTVLYSPFSITANVSSGFIITMMCNYSDELLPLLGVDESTLAIYYWNATDNSWYELPTNLDMANNQLTASVDHLTIFAVFGQASGLDIGDGSYLPIVIAGIVILALFVLSVLGLRFSRSRVPWGEHIIESPARPIEEETVPEETAPEPVEPEEPQPLPTSEPICSYCGHQNPPGARYCIRCGRSLGEIYG